MSAPVRTEGLFWRPHGCNIATGKDPLSEAVAEVLQRFFENFSATDFSPHLRRASCTFVRQIAICPTKVLALRGRGRSLVATLFKPYMDTDRKLTDMTDRNPRTPSYKYSFRLNEEQNIRFNELLCKAGSEHNRSRFIVKRIFGEEFVVVRRDPSKVQFIARLNDFYFQFQKLGNNCVPVKAI